MADDVDDVVVGFVARSIHLNNTTLTLMGGNIAEQTTDAIVNAAHTSSFRSMDSGVSGALRNACAPADVTEIPKTWWDSKGEHSSLAVPTGQAGVQEAQGGLAEQGVKWIIHAVGPIWTDWPVGKACFKPVMARIRTTVSRALDAASRMGARSIVIPAISGGVFTHYSFSNPNIKRAEMKAARVAVIQSVLKWIADADSEADDNANADADANADAIDSQSNRHALTDIRLIDLPSSQPRGNLPLFLQAWDSLIPLPP